MKKFYSLLKTTVLCTLMICMMEMIGIAEVPAITSFITHKACSGATIVMRGVHVTTSITSFNPPGACSGVTTISIFGSGFTGTTGVTIGGVAAGSFTVNSDNNITATVTADATGTIAVTGSGGTAISSSNFTRSNSYTPFAYVANYASGTVNVINTANNTVIATVTVGGGPTGVCISPDGTKAYVTNQNDGNISVINTAGNTVVATIPVGNMPNGVCISPNGTKAYVTNQNDGTISVINTASNMVTATINVGSNPIGVSVSPDGTKAYVVNRNDYNVSVINTTSNTVTATVAVGSFPIGVIVSPDGTKAYVANSGSNNVSVINTASNTVTATVAVGSFPYGVSVSPDGTKVYVANYFDGTISAINTASNTVTTTVTVGNSPVGVSVSPDGTKAYVVNRNDYNVSVINTATNTVTAILTVVSPSSFGNFIANVPTACPTPAITGFSPKFGGTGTTVTISGSRFTGATGVTFGGTGGTNVTVVNDNTITAKVDTGSSGKVCVSTGSGTGCSVDTFIYFPPYPVITSFTPTSGTTGTIVTIKGSYFTGVRDVMFGGTWASSVNFIDDNTITAVVGNGSIGSIAVIVHFKDGNSTGISSGIFTYLAAGNTAPVFVNTSPQALAICENAGATSINTLLTINDPDAGQTETFSITGNPLHGSITVGTTIGTGLLLMYGSNANGTRVGTGVMPANVMPAGVWPTGWSYTPANGYSGSDAFTIQVSDGNGGTASTTVNVTVNAPTSSLTNNTICSRNLPYIWNGLTFNAAGTQTAHLTNSVNCDSAAMLNLTVNAPTSSVTNTSICANALPYIWNGLTFNAAGTQTAHLTNSVNCDSAAMLNLTVNTATSSLTNTTICASSLPYTWNGLTFKGAGTKTVHLTNSVYCDSVATLNLTVTSAPSTFNYKTPDSFNIGIPVTVLIPAIDTTIKVIATGFNQPDGVAEDAVGNVYVSDMGNNAVKKIATNGTITTLGSGFNQPYGVAVDAAGNVYVADYGNNAVKKIAPDGISVISIGSGFNQPLGVAVDATGNVYVSDMGNNAVKKIAPDGITVTNLGVFKSPTAITIDYSGNLYVVADSIKKIALNGTISNLYPMQSLFEIAVDNENNLYLATFDPFIVKFSAIDVTVYKIGNGYLKTATGVTFNPKGFLYVSDAYNNAVYKIHLKGSVANSYSISPALPAGLNFNTTTGTISGTPTQGSGNTTYTVTASNCGGNTISTLNIAVTGIPNYVWTGATSTNWSIATNWSNNVLPTNGVTVTIPSAPTNQPILSTTVNIGSIVLNGSVAINGQTFIITGAVSGTGTIKGSSTSSLTVNSSSNNTINFGTSANDSLLANLTVSGTGTVTLGSGLGITTLLSVNSGSLTTGNHLTLKSTSISNTAIVAPVGGTVTGNVTVERYIPKGVKAYQNLSAGGVYNTGSIFKNWQEGGVNNNGYGIFVTGKKGTVPGVDVTTGLDISPAGNISMYNYTNYLTYTPVTTTKNTNLDPYTGYLTVVYGNRALPLIPSSVFDASANMNAAATIRTTGSLVTGTVTFDTTGVKGTVGSNFNSSVTRILPSHDTGTFIANPYACAIDWNNLSRTNLNNTYYYYEPTYLTGGYQAFVCFNSITGSNNPNKSKINRYIQPGQGFWVQTDNTVSKVNRILVINESNKVTNQPFTAVFGTGAAGINRLAMSLWKNGENIDGAVAAFDNNFTSSYGDEDSKKMFGNGPGLYITEGLNNLSIDGIPTPAVNDRIALQMSGLTKDSVYELHLDAQEFNSNGLTAYLEDAVLNTETVVGTASTVYSFTAKAASESRFTVEFRQGALPVHFVTVKAKSVEKKINAISWTVSDEVNIARYEVEQSFTGKDFIKIATVKAAGIATYTALDNVVKAGTIYYRIKAIDNSGKDIYSNVVTVVPVILSGIVVTPNPVKGNKIVVQLNNLVKGSYVVELYNTAGQLVLAKEMAIDGTTTIELPLSNNTTNGLYNLQVKGENNYKTEIIIQR